MATIYDDPGWSARLVESVTRNPFAARHTSNLRRGGMKHGTTKHGTTTFYHHSQSTLAAPPEGGKAVKSAFGWIYFSRGDRI
jgi:hypothetical protein